MVKTNIEIPIYIVLFKQIVITHTLKSLSIMHNIQNEHVNIILMRLISFMLSLNYVRVVV